jgi:hypothetical protein
MNGLIPISLYVSMEVVKLVQAPATTAHALAHAHTHARAPARSFRMPPAPAAVARLAL